MSEERKKILELLSNAKITVAEAEKLLAALEDTPVNPKPDPKFLRVEVDEAGKDKVNLRIPFSLLNAGVKFASLMPESIQGKLSQALHAKGLDWESLANLNIDVNNDKEKVRITVE